MQQQLDSLKDELIERIYKRFMLKYKGNKLQFAKAASCSEKTIRQLFEGKQGMTINLLFKLASALNTTPSTLLKGLEISTE